MKIQIRDGIVLLPTGLKKVSLELEKGRITRIGNVIKKDPLATQISAGGKYVLPGFIDLHTNGLAGFDLTNGLYNTDKNSFSSSKENYHRGLNNALWEYAKHGTTLVGLTTLEASIKQMKKIFNLIAEYKSSSDSLVNDIFYGIYMEGTFMKDKKFKGAHNPKFFFEPSIKLFKEFQNSARGNIKIVNVVPEWGKSALKIIEYLASKNIISAAGHTNATGEEYLEAINKGLQLAIHVLNGPSSSSYKPFDKGGALETYMTSDTMYVEIIPDGYHVDKAYILDIIKRKGIDKCIAISDSMFITKMKNLDEFKLNGVKGKISKNREYLYIDGKETANSLFGSVLTMDKAFANLVTWFTQPINGIWNKLHEPLSFEEALLQSSKMCSVNPAKILGIYSEEKMGNVLTGSIEIGKRADLVFTDILKKDTNFDLKIERVLLNGNEVFIN